MSDMFMILWNNASFLLKVIMATEIKIETNYFTSFYHICICDLYRLSQNASLNFK